MDNTSNNNRRRGRVSIKWDEDAILEHNKERGTRQKIDEPPTPFRYGSDSDPTSEPEENDHKGMEICNASGPPGEEIKHQWNELEAKLNYLSAESKCSMNNNEKQNITTDSFKNKRSAHYNEFKVLKTVKQVQVDDGDADIDDDGMKDDDI